MGPRATDERQFGGGDSVVAVDDLRVTAGRNPLVDSVSFEIGAGQRVGLLGRSGSGKSTIAAAIVGRTAPALTVTGTVKVAGHEVTHLPPPQRPAVARPAMVFQYSATALNPLVRVRAQLRRAGTVPAEDALRDVGFAEPDRILASFPMELSGGQRQRVCIALALACGGPVLIADEPTSALDVVSAATVLTALDRMKDRALLLITHDVAVAASRCDRLIVVDDGVIVEDGPTTRVLESPSASCTRALVERARAADPMQALAAVSQ